MSGNGGDAFGGSGREYRGIVEKVGLTERRVGQSAELREIDRQ
jgi:hypothetical protein